MTTSVDKLDDYTIVSIVASCKCCCEWTSYYCVFTGYLL